MSVIGFKSKKMNSEAQNWGKVWNVLHAVKCQTKFYYLRFFNRCVGYISQSLDCLSFFLNNVMYNRFRYAFLQIQQYVLLLQVSIRETFVAWSQSPRLSAIFLELSLSWVNFVISGFIQGSYGILVVILIKGHIEYICMICPQDRLELGYTVPTYKLIPLSCVQQHVFPTYLDIKVGP